MVSHNRYRSNHCISNGRYTNKLTLWIIQFLGPCKWLPCTATFLPHIAMCGIIACTHLSRINDVVTRPIQLKTIVIIRTFIIRQACCWCKWLLRVTFWAGCWYNGQVGIVISILIVNPHERLNPIGWDCCVGFVPAVTIRRLDITNEVNSYNIFVIIMCKVCQVCSLLWIVNTWGLRIYEWDYMITIHIHIYSRTYRKPLHGDSLTAVKLGNRCFIGIRVTQ